MKQTAKHRYYLEGNTLITLTATEGSSGSGVGGDSRSTRCYPTDRAAAEAYDALLGEHQAPAWPVQTRKQAATAGLRYYYTGLLCIHNHEARRYVLSGVCTVCNNNNVRRYNEGVRGTSDGMTPLRLSVYRRDVEQIRAYVAGLNKAHGATEPCVDCKGCRDAD